MVCPEWYWWGAWILSVLFAMLCGYIASTRGHSLFWYSLFGCFFLIITLIVVLVLPQKQKAQRDSEGAGTPPSVPAPSGAGRPLVT
jgi:hypothetical protein